MTDGFDTSSGDIVVTSGGIIKFSTAAKKFNRVPLAEIDLGSSGSPYSVTFPNFLSPTYFYEYNTYSDPIFGSSEACTSFGVISPQEWGPSASPYGFTAPHILADIDVGAAPAGTDYVDVQCNLQRTTTPPTLGGVYVWPIGFLENQWTNLTDGALVVEKFASFARMFWFEIVAGRILLRRKQSVGSAQVLTHLLDTKQNAPGTNSLGPTHAGGSGCANNNTRDYTSVFSGQFTLIPCSSN